MKRPTYSGPIDPTVIRRLDSLHYLIDNEYEGKPSVFQEKTGIKMGQVGQWFSGYRALRDKALKRLEAETGKPPGWFDIDHWSVDYTNLGQEVADIFSSDEPINKRAAIEEARIRYMTNVSEITKRPKVPLISLIQAGELTDVLDIFHPGEAVHWVEPIYSDPTKNAYALKVEGDSMESPIPGSQTFPEGTILIVDPNVASGPNDYVIAKDVATQKATFKKLTTDGVRWFLKPLNPAYQTVEIDDPALRVIGRVIEFQPPGGKL